MVKKALLFLSLFITCFCYSQNLDIFHIGYDEGLTSELCQSIELDDQGNLWIGGTSTLSKFDGYKVKNFNSENSPLQEERVEFLFKDQNNYIWIVLKVNVKLNNISPKFDPGYEHRIYVVDPTTDEFQSVENYTNSLIKAETVSHVYRRADKLYFYTVDKTLFSVTNKVEKVLSTVEGELFIGPGKNNSYFCLSNDSLRIRNFRNEIIHNNIKAEVTKFCRLGENGNLFLYKGLIKKEEFEISSDIGLYYAPFFEEYKSEYWALKDGTFLLVSKISLLEDGIILNGFFYLKKDNYNSKFEISNIKDCKIVDSKTTVFATTHGVYVIEKHETRFKKLLDSINVLNSIRGIYFTEDLSIWNYKDALEVSSKDDDYDPSFLTDYQNQYGRIFSFYQDPIDDKVFWTCGFIYGSTKKIDFKNKKILIDLDSNKKNLHVATTMLRSTKTGRLYLGSNFGMREVEELPGHINSRRVKFNASPNDFEFHRLHQFDDLIWCATSKGVFVFDEIKNDLIKIQLQKNNSECYVNFIHRDKINRQIYWLGTRGNGLIEYNHKTGESKSFTELDGLSNNLVHSIYEDSHKRLWLATNKFLSCLDKTDNKFYTFTTNDGISHPEFNVCGDYLDTISNTLYLAGLNGITYFNPDSIDISFQSLSLRILKALKITNKGKAEDITQQLIHDSTLDMVKEDISVEISLATAKIKNHKDVKYSYRIPEIDSTWTTQGSNIIKINRLPYGTYSLEIIGDQNKVDSRTDILVLQLNLVRPLSEHPLVFVLIALAFGIGLIQVFKYRNRIVLERNLFLEGEVEKRTLELRQSNESKNRLFALLAHDLRNPIASLSNIAEKINFLNQRGRQNEINEIAISVQDRVKALSKNIDDILLWAIRERSQQEEINSDFNLRETIENVLLLYPEEIALKNLSIEIFVDSNTIINTDEKAFMVLLRNFVINAIKFNKEQGSIRFYKKDNSVLIVDTGVGINDSKNLKSRAENSNFSSHGLGLALSQEIANACGLGFELRGNKEGGATVEIFL